jgi:hypothetical protein
MFVSQKCVHLAPEMNILMAKYVSATRDLDVPRAQRLAMDFASVKDRPPALGIWSTTRAPIVVLPKNHRNARR